MCLSQESFTRNMSYERLQVGNHPAGMPDDLGSSAGGSVKDWRMNMFKVIEDKVLITRSEFEDYMQLKMARKMIDSASVSRQYLDAGLARMALGLDAVKEEDHVEV